MLTISECLLAADTVFLIMLRSLYDLSNLAAGSEHGVNQAGGRPYAALQFSEAEPIPDAIRAPVMRVQPGLHLPGSFTALEASGSPQTGARRLVHHPIPLA